MRRYYCPYSGAAPLLLLLFVFSSNQFVWAQSKGALENPRPGSYQSGVRVISGWVCEAEKIEIIFNETDRQRVSYGTERADTAGVCGDTNNGFGLLFNYNLLGDGSHTVRALADGVEFATATVIVNSFGEEFLRDASGEIILPYFPDSETDVLLRWQEAQQNFVIEKVIDGGNAAGLCCRYLEDVCLAGYLLEKEYDWRNAQTVLPHGCIHTPYDDHGLTAVWRHETDTDARYDPELDTLERCENLWNDLFIWAVIDGKLQEIYWNTVGSGGGIGPYECKKATDHTHIAIPPSSEKSASIVRTIGGRLYRRDE